MSLILIAESGGSKTDWCLIEDGIVQDKFTTQGLHPDLWSKSLWNKISLILDKHVNIQDTTLKFYGAGCLRKENRSLIKEEFIKIGFKKINVFSDLDAAGKALYGRGSGWVVIMGTGSVLFSYKSGKISNVTGGAGHLIGDEGSGYYFGRLILESYLSGEMPREACELLEREISRQELHSIDIVDKDRLAEISLFLSDYDSEIEPYHRRNFELFYQTHLKPNPFIQSIRISGSYAYYHENLIRETFSKYRIEIQVIIERPIDLLIEEFCTDK